VEFLPADLSNLGDVRRLAADIRRRCPTLDVLVNNAGARFNHYETSSSGLERTFATNHLGHFLLTALLLDGLLAARQGRVISVASGVHLSVLSEGEWDAGRETYERKAAYARSKLANVLFSYELSRRLQGTTVTSNALDPGGVATNLGRNNGWIAWARHLGYYALKRQLQSPDRAARIIVHLASSPELASVSGKYFCEMRETTSSPLSQNQDVARRLWELSVKLSGLDSSVGKAWKYFRPENQN